jgi:hypothetical protein
MRGLAPQFLVEKMAPAAVAELIVGIKRDPQFGLALLLGAGGILVELLQDTATLLLPVSREDILAALSRLRVAAILGGFRGQRVADVDAATTAIQAIATYAEAHSDSLLELDVNPLLVLQDGALAVDAMIRLRH